ncbi:helix-turn-helix domain-containing protein [Staphylococcus shinii]|jgi:transcriptional regulator with XRE-family HTH domain|uniref:XRE family transcriptional regulator n=1 Tax=Staphylococcus shinii TaxID=2912228 RepID=A0A418IEU0_9STAP|nr:XRE family transcriptional regulator [Staphylococcus shinii]MDW8564990.1 XRE family transcriptional regulator [Staphylococcus shinii]MDW8568232.1 XRE family transcriptional regulator [Staphylococcus shinii]MDW8571023.1 XRE family transcriptional regulator [Staphylococcus shinii]MDW8573073.1 XRE family transcriptional regulator [Staphylococcus shinii]RIN00512.1 XRE family transcriptional regulator [Staphylococcus shinii]
MKEINDIIAENLKLFRKQNGYSLEYLSVLTEVSKTMLGQIERKESIPSITTLWKIANGLKVSFAELTQDNEEFVKKITIHDIQPLTSSEDKYSIYPYFKFDIAKKFESHMVIIEPGGTVNGEPRGSSANEYITVFDGTLTLVLGDERVVVKKDESIKFNGNLFHKYLNEHDLTLRLNMIIHY